MDSSGFAGKPPAATNREAAQAMTRAPRRAPPRPPPGSLPRANGIRTSWRRHRLKPSVATRKDEDEDEDGEDE